MSPVQSVKDVSGMDLSGIKCKGCVRYGPLRYKV